MTSGRTKLKSGRDIVYLCSIIISFSCISRRVSLGGVISSNDGFGDGHLGLQGEVSISSFMSKGSFISVSKLRVPLKLSLQDIYICTPCSNQYIEASLNDV